jgi:hypothetical protein
MVRSGSGLALLLALVIAIVVAVVARRPWSQKGGKTSAPAAIVAALVLGAAVFFVTQEVLALLAEL